jgi:hypothetical protein
MQPRLARDLRDAGVAVEGQGRDDRVAGMLGDMACNGRRVGRVHAEGRDIPLAVGPNDRTRGVGIDVGELDLVADGVREQARDERADLAGAENEYAMHRKSA